jgi:methylglutaconyl-CoA hydratase
MKHFTSILVESSKGCACVTLNRPDRRNAVDARMAEELSEVFILLGQDSSIHVVTLAANGSAFCAGADINWLGSPGTVSVPQARQDAEQLAMMFRTIDACPCPVIGCIQGAAYGGGIGLIAACDIAVAATNVTFAFSEVRLGLVPAVIAPFVLAKTGDSFVRRYCLTGELFSASIAQDSGLIHDVVEPAALDARVASLAELIAHLAPQAVRGTKTLLHRLPHLSHEECWTACVEENIRARLSSEAKEGLRAFREHRTPNWVMSSGGE